MAVVVKRTGKLEKEIMILERKKISWQNKQRIANLPWKYSSTIKKAVRTHPSRFVGSNIKDLLRKDFGQDPVSKTDWFIPLNEKKIELSNMTKKRTKNIIKEKSYNIFNPPSNKSIYKLKNGTITDKGNLNRMVNTN